MFLEFFVEFQRDAYLEFGVVGGGFWLGFGLPEFWFCRRLGSKCGRERRRNLRLLCRLIRFLT